MMINELIEQIGGRDRLENIKKSASSDANETVSMAIALLAVMNAKTDFYIHRVEFCDTYGPEIELRAFNCQLDASKCRDDHGGEVIEAYTTPQSASVPEGYKLVQIEPSKEMLLASKRYKAKNKVPTGPGVYRAMIAAATAPGGE